MLTGVEIAGLVLAAFPLVAKHYREGLAPLNTLWHFGERRETWLTDLELQRTIFKNSITTLLSIINTERGLINRLLGEDSGEEWKAVAAEFDLLLKGVLLDSYQPFQDTMAEMWKAFESLLAFLKGPESNDARKFVHKVRLSYSSKRTSMTDRIKSKNYELGELVRGIQNLQSFRRGDGSATVYRQIRERAQEIHDAIARCSKKCYSNSLQAHKGIEHYVDIRLEARVADLCEYTPIEYEKPSELNGMHYFRLIFKKNKQSPGPCVDMSYSDQSISNGFIQVTPKVKFANASPATTKIPKPDKTNTFQSFCLLHDNMEQQITLPKGNWVGFLLDENDSPHATYTSSDADFYPTDVTVPLSTIIGTPRVLGTQAPRLRLALKLASACIQLHGTSWSPASLSSDIIYILPPGKDRESQPFFGTAFPHDGAHLARPNISDVALQLAKIMIEIGYSATLANIRTPGSPGVVVSEFEKIKKLARGPGLRMGEDYKRALQNCIRWCESKPQVGSRNLEDDEICDTFYDEVIFHLIKGHIKHAK